MIGVYIEHDLHPYWEFRQQCPVRLIWSAEIPAASRQHWNLPGPLSSRDDRETYVSASHSPSGIRYYCRLGGIRRGYSDTKDTVVDR